MDYQVTIKDLVSLKKLGIGDRLKFLHIEAVIGRDCRVYPVGWSEGFSFPTPEDWVLTVIQSQPTYSILLSQMQGMDANSLRQWIYGQLIVGSTRTSLLSLHLLYFQEQIKERLYLMSHRPPLAPSNNVVVNRSIPPLKYAETRAVYQLTRSFIHHVDRFIPLFLDASTKSCSEICSACASLDEQKRMIFCGQCGEGFHVECVETVCDANKEERLRRMSNNVHDILANGEKIKSLENGWKCLNCLVCESCLRPDPEDSLLVCDQCDRGFHTTCLKSPLFNIPSGRWLCDECVQCQNCGSRLPGGCGWSGKNLPKKYHCWMFDSTLCGDCGKLRQGGHFCPVCDKVYRDNDFTVKMVCCDSCDRWIHLECDPKMNDEAYKNLCENEDITYDCPKCDKAINQSDSDLVKQTDDNVAKQLDGVVLTMLQSDAVHRPESDEAPFSRENDIPQELVPMTSKDVSMFLFGVETEISCDVATCVLCRKDRKDSLLPLPNTLLPYPPFLCDFPWFRSVFVHQSCLFSIRDIEISLPEGFVFFALRGIQTALRQFCDVCNEKGATLVCTDCGKKYHLLCFHKVAPGSISFPFSCCTYKESELLRLFEKKKILIMNDDDLTSSCLYDTEKRSYYYLRVGALIVTLLGQIPYDPEHFHTESTIYPIGYVGSRLYWSCKRPFERTLIRCEIHERSDRHPLFRLVVQDDGHVIEGLSVHQVVNAYFVRLYEAYKGKQCPKGKAYFGYAQSPVFCDFFFGLNVRQVRLQIESLPNAGRCTRYKFQTLSPLEVKQRLDKINVNGPPSCARIRPYCPKRKEQVGFSIATESAPSKRKENDKKEGKRFLLPISMRYRQLKALELKHVRVAPSGIQGYGLYNRVTLFPDDMVIEYAGELVGQKVADKREKLYDDALIGCYMFRIEDDMIVDATKKGNPARFINHSCHPNCYAKIINVDGTRKVMIFALRQIDIGEELTYDYKFPIESNKIPCHCGAPSCRKYMN